MLPSPERFYSYCRFPTREVLIGSVGVGRDNPIRIQSMTQTNTLDTASTVDECMKLFDAGCEIVRITAPGKKEAENLKNIRERLTNLGYRNPLIADIHFSQSAALIALQYVEKVRINPGNYADRKKLVQKTYSDSEYEIELERLHEAFSPLILRAKELGRSIRIGSNHGSLSDRILNRYGDTPEGMVESAIEFISIAETHGFHNIIVSMKASDITVMRNAYRLLAKTFLKTGRDYPFHLGVTEAGEGRDGRIKSIAGIASLLEEGIGDTIRVSLTEPPVNEIPVAKKIADRYRTESITKKKELFSFPELNFPPESQRERTAFLHNFLYRNKTHEKRTVLAGAYLSSHRVHNDRTASEAIQKLIEAGCDLLFVSESSAETRSYRDSPLAEAAAQNKIAIPIVYDTGLNPDIAQIPDSIGDIADGISLSIPLSNEALSDHETLHKLKNLAQKNSLLPFVHFIVKTPHENIHFILREALQKIISTFSEGCVLSIHPESDAFSRLDKKSSPTFLYRQLALSLSQIVPPESIPHFPILFRNRYPKSDESLYSSSLHAGGILLDHIPSAVLFELNSDSESKTDSKAKSGSISGEGFQLCMDVLQCSRIRLTRTEFISCPTCGRTAFDIHSLLSEIKTKTDHLASLKIAVMGCVVNGPGEMMDADFGCVGAGENRVHLYKNRDIVKKNIAASEAADELVLIIKEAGAWKEPV